MCCMHRLPGRRPPPHKIHVVVDTKVMQPHAAHENRVRLRCSQSRRTRFSRATRSRRAVAAAAAAADCAATKPAARRRREISHTTAARRLRAAAPILAAPRMRSGRQLHLPHPSHFRTKESKPHEYTHPNRARCSTFDGGYKLKMFLPSFFMPSKIVVEISGINPP